jgi:hypothetical protein
VSWSRKKLAVVATIIFVAHVVGIFAIHTPRPMVILPDGFRTARAWPVPATTNQTAELDGLNDPLVFAGAHEHGFSAAAWMMRPRQEFALTNAPTPPRYLEYSRTPLTLQNEAGAERRGEAELPLLQFALPAERPKSTLMIEGDLKKRGLAKVIEVPIQHASDVLSNTVVQVAVRADGFPFSARIVSGSGSRGADMTALDLATKARFSPLPKIRPGDGAEMQWGELVFQWFTADLSATNLPAKTAVSAAR